MHSCGCGNPTHNRALGAGNAWVQFRFLISGGAVIGSSTPRSTTILESRFRRMSLHPFDAEAQFHPIAEGDLLRRVAVRGAGTTLVASGASFCLQLISTVVLARLLTPNDFGVVTMVTTFS